MSLSQGDVAVNPQPNFLGPAGPALPRLRSGLSGAWRYSFKTELDDERESLGDADREEITQDFRADLVLAGFQDAVGGGLNDADFLPAGMARPEVSRSMRPATSR